MYYLIININDYNSLLIVTIIVRQFKNETLVFNFGLIYLRVSTFNLKNLLSMGLV